MLAVIGESETMRLARTLAQLRPAQAGQRIRLRAQRLALRRLPLAGRWLLSGPRPASAVGWPAGFTPLDGLAGRDWPGAAELAAGRLPLLGETRTVAPADAAGDAIWWAADWEQPDAPLLWRYHLYYWDWAWGLANPAGDSGPPLARPRPDGRVAPDGPGPAGTVAGGGALAAGAAGAAGVASPEAATEAATELATDVATAVEPRAVFAMMWESWRALTAPGHGPAWHPYPASLRAWSLCGVHRALASGSPIEGEFTADLAAHAGFLRRSLETDVGGNHLIKNLKALAGLAVFFDDGRLLAAALGRLRRQLAVQVLPDGGHFERAPAYHCQVLADLIDIDCLLQAAGRDRPAGLPEAIQAMRRWLGAVLGPAGEVPLLNDGFPVSPSLLAQLAPDPPPNGPQAPRVPVILLPDSGLARAAAGGWRLLADVGAPCPRELPAHAHADTLSCLVHVDGEALLVDTGTSTYAAGAARSRERSTAAHSTLELDGRDSTEVWGAFRAGRRARVRDLSARADEAGVVTIEATHDGYRFLPGRPAHRRRWRLSATGLRVDDIVTGRGRHRIVARWHLPPDAHLELTPGGAVVVLADGGRFTVAITTGPAGPAGPARAGRQSAPAAGRPALAATTAELGAGFGQTRTAPVLTCSLTVPLPAAISTVWRRAQPLQEPT